MSRQAYLTALEKLFRHTPSYQKQGASALKKGLAGIKSLCSQLGNPQESYSIIHIAGTNGKGTVADTLARCLDEAGYRVGLYTSPHIIDFRERIRVGKTLITEKEAVAWLSKNEPWTRHQTYSFFELSLAMALDHFKSQKVGVAVIETGLGGRWDSTNIVQPILSVITSISYDHEAILGHSLEEITYEKAGIIKAKIPVIIGNMAKEARAIIAKKAQEMQAPLVRADIGYTLKEMRGAEHTMVPPISRQVLNVYHQGKLVYKDLKLTDSLGYHTDNLQVILATLKQLTNLGYVITKNALRKGVSLSGLRGRMEWLSHHPPAVVDIAHNERALFSFFEALSKLYPKKKLEQKHWHIVFGLSEDKLHERLVAVLPPEARYYVSAARFRRAVPAPVLAKWLQERHFNVVSYHSSAVAAWAEAQAATAAPKQKTGLTLACGSAYLVGEILEREDRIKQA